MALAQSSRLADAPQPASMASVDEAIDLVVAHARPLPSERARLEDAGGRILAADVVSQRRAPSGDVSAMDGYAVRDADLAADWNALKVVGQSYAGAGFTGMLEPGCAVRIFTGAPAPSGADRVVLQEDVRSMGGGIVMVQGGDLGKRHIRRAGSDFAAGDVLVAAGCLLSPARLVAAAAADLAAVEVVARPKVLIVSTGDELRAPGEGSARGHSIPESVSFGVAELARRYGAAVLVRRRLPDDLEAMRAAAAEMLAAADVVVVIGGASVGERDFSKAMFETADLSLVFSKVAMRPGKPVWFGKARGAPVLGLPGNPTAALVTARLFLAPLLAGLGGRCAESALAWRRRPLAAPLEATGQWECLLGATFDGRAVRAIENRDSSAQKALAAVDVLIRRRPQQPQSLAGEPVEVLDF